MAHRYGSRVILDQVKEAVEAAGGELAELPTVAQVKSLDESSTEATPMPCVAQFPDQKSCDKFKDSVRNLPLDITEGIPMPHQTKYKVAINMTIPTAFETTAPMANIPKPQLLRLALLRSAGDEVNYKKARAEILEDSGFSVNSETEEELDRAASEVIDEMNATKKKDPHNTKD